MRERQIRESVQIHFRAFRRYWWGRKKNFCRRENGRYSRLGIVKPGIIDDCLTPVTAVPPWNTCQPWWMQIDGRIHRYRWRRRGGRRPWAFIAPADIEVFPASYTYTFLLWPRTKEHNSIGVYLPADNLLKRLARVKQHG